MFKQLKHFMYWLEARKQPGGLEKTPKDERDFGLWWFGSYTPKETRKVLTTQKINNQGALSTCQWNATITAKEIDEGESLSIRSIVNYGLTKSLVGLEGLSNLRSGQKVLCDWGATTQEQCPEGVAIWYNYSHGIDVNALTPLAKNHKAQSYFEVTGRDQILKIVDEGKAMTTGIDWYSGYNQGGGFSAPWIISKTVGYKVGGHAITLIGYDLNYYGRKVYVFQNSYGKEWGDDGKFYIDMDFFDANNYGVYVNYDIPNATKITAADIIENFRMKNVKGTKSGTIYFIYSGKKCPYPSYYDYEKICEHRQVSTKDFIVVDQTALDQIPNGEMLFWDNIKNIKPFNEI